MHRMDAPTCTTCFKSLSHSKLTFFERVVYGTDQLVLYIYPV